MLDERGKRAFTLTILFAGQPPRLFREENNAVFGVLFLGLVRRGFMLDLGTVFAFADVAMGLLVQVGLAVLALLLKVGLRLMKKYHVQLKSGLQPIPIRRSSPI